MPRRYLLHQCSWCGAFLVSRYWLRLPGVPLVTGNLMLRRPTEMLPHCEITVSHGACPSCVKAQMALIGRG